MDREIIAEKKIESDGEYMSLTSGISMRPLLRQGKDIVQVVRPKRPFKKFDVGLYRAKEGKLILHRIIAFDGDYCIFRGDNLLTTERIHKDRVFGILKGVLRNKKRYIDCEKSKKYKLYVFVITRTFFIRYLWQKKICPFLSKCKHLIIK